MRKLRYREVIRFCLRLRSWRKRVGIGFVFAILDFRILVVSVLVFCFEIFLRFCCFRFNFLKLKNVVILI